LTGANADAGALDGARAGAVGAVAAGGSGGAAGAPLERANFGLSGALARDAGVESKKWVPPSDARVPDRKWRLYVFKGASPDPIATLHLHRQSAVLFGRDAAAVEVVTEHASTSKQHAALVFRSVRAAAAPGDMGPPAFSIRPYLIDLESTNGTTLNGARVDAARYVELRAADVLRFGESSREYVLVCEGD
jgi:smad nuclear-interacting protein 1